MNRYWWECDKCNWELSERVSGSLGCYTDRDVRYCKCNPPMTHFPKYGKDTSQ